MGVGRSLGMSGNDLGLSPVLEAEDTPQTQARLISHLPLLN